MTFTVSVASENFGIVTIVDWNGIVCMTGWSSLKYISWVFYVFAFAVFLGVRFLPTYGTAISPASIVLHCVAAVVLPVAWGNLRV